MGADPVTRRMNSSIGWAAGLAAFALLAGCASPPTPSLYGWNGYQPQVYEYLKSGGNANPEEQIAQLEAGQQQIEQAGKSLPPGYRATLGMLYAKAGRADKGVASFAAEKSNFPESSGFMDFLSRDLGGKTP